MKKQNLTLIEVWVSLATVAMLISLLSPGVITVREKDKRAICKANIYTIGSALSLYSRDNKQTLPNSKKGWSITIFGNSAKAKIGQKPVQVWSSERHGKAINYLNDENLSNFYCPSQRIFSKKLQIANWGKYFTDSHYQWRIGKQAPQSYLSADPKEPILADGFAYYRKAYMVDTGHRDGYSVLKLDNSAQFIEGLQKVQSSFDTQDHIYWNAGYFKK